VLPPEAFSAWPGVWKLLACTCIAPPRSTPHRMAHPRSGDNTNPVPPETLRRPCVIALAPVNIPKGSATPELVSGDKVKAAA
jgi:hypothetical protein